MDLDGEGGDQDVRKEHNLGDYGGQGRQELKDIEIEEIFTTSALPAILPPNPDCALLASPKSRLPLSPEPH